MSSYCVTGTSRGLGLGFARQLSANPSNKVFAIARNPDKANELQELASERSNLTVICADVTIVETLKAAADIVSKATGGTLDVLIHNAALVDFQSMALTPTDVENEPDIAKKATDASMDANFWSVVRGTNIFLPLIQAGKGQRKVVTISSGIVDLELIRKTEIASGFTYAIAKAAVNILMAKYAAQLTSSQGIKFLSLAPGWVATQEASPETEQMKAYLTQAFARYKSDIEGQISPKQSVEHCLEVIPNLTVEQSGEFLSHHGNQEWL